jgi:hypothetical protein
MKRCERTPRPILRLNRPAINRHSGCLTVAGEIPMSRVLLLITAETETEPGVSTT